MPSIRAGAASLGVLALLVTGIAVAPPAIADPLSPATGARPSTSGNPTAGPGGVVYFVDATGGNDSNAGTSPAAAWRTLAKVSSQTLAPGDVVAFERGDTFTGSATISGGGTSTNPVTVTAYGSVHSLF